jgi:DUF4097 and DUF4098 domain-containing protein YvlB
MPTFDTPGPITTTVELAVGELTVAATDRTDTVVEVRPTNPDRKGDVDAAQQTRVEYAAGHLLVRTPKRWRQYSPFGAGDESVTVTIALPAGSTLEYDAGAGTVRSTGRLGAVTHHSGAGEVRLDQTGPLRVKTGAGDVTVARADGDVEVSTGTGGVRLAIVDGTAVVKNSNGDTWVGTVTGDSRVSSANGRITIEHALGGLVAKSANGDIRLAEVRHGAVHATTAMGRVDVGVLDGVAAWLDLDTKFGVIRSELDAGERPAADADTVEVTARSAFGDVVVRRAYADPVEDAS